MNTNHYANFLFNFSMIALLAIPIAFIFLVVFHESNKTAKYWNEALIVKICKSGTTIYQMKDGTYRTTNSKVLNPNVCE